MTVVAYFEGGPMDGKTMEIESPTNTHVIMTRDQAQAYYLADDLNAMPPMIEATKVMYWLEVIPHRDGCVTYFDSEAARDIAWVEDSLDVDSPTGMIESCPPPRIIEAYTKHLSRQRGLAFHDEVSRRMLESPLAPIGAG